MRKIRTAIAVVVILVVFVVLAALVRGRLAAQAAPAGQAPAALPVPVKSVQIARKAIRVEYRESSHLEPWASLRVASEVSGRVSAREVQPGAIVDAGDVIVKIDREMQAREVLSAEAEVRGAQAGVLAAEARCASAEEDVRSAEASVSEAMENHQVALAKAAEVDANIRVIQEEVERNERLLGQGAVSRSDVQKKKAELDIAYGQAQAAKASAAVAESQVRQAEIKVEQAKSAVGSAKAAVSQAEEIQGQAAQRLTSLQASLERLDIRSPIRGLVEEVHLAEGEVAQAGESIAEILDLTNLRAVVPIDPWVRDALAVGTEVTLTLPALGGLTLTGSIERIGATVNTDTYKVPLVLRVPNEISADQRANLPPWVELPETYPIRPGHLVECRIPSRRVVEVVEIERAWTKTDLGEQIVFVLGRSDETHEGKDVSIAEKRVLCAQTPPFHYELLHVLSGLSPGDTIATSALSRLRDHARVVVED